MGLSDRFLLHAASTARGSFAACPTLEGALQRLVREGLACWPDLGVAADRFLEFLARHLSPEAASPGALEALHAADLYLACAYGLRARRAFAVIEAEYMPRVRHALGRLGTPPPAILDIQQELRQRLVEMADPSLARRSYSGRGALAGWMVLCAVREAGVRRRRDGYEPPYGNDALEAFPAAEADLEQQLLISSYREPFQRAFQGALASLTARERNLLRYRFVSRSSIDQIAGLYGVHRATAARWVLRAQAHLVEETQAQFLSLSPMSEESMSEIVVALRGHLSLDLDQLLLPADEHAPAG